MSNALTARMAMSKHGFQFTHSLGQNFLLNDEIIACIVDAVGVERGDCVLEIGAGPGILTAELCARGAKVLALELDKTLEPVLREVLAPYPQAGIVFQDTLKADIGALAAEYFGEGNAFSVVANLPYYITTDVLLKLLKSGLPIERVGVLVQQEAAERIMSRPGQKSWCALSATVQYYGKPEVLMHVPPEAFTPRPHVMSCLLNIEMYGADKPCPAQNEQVLLSLINCAFAMRRKTLANNLSASFAMPRERALGLLRTCGLDDRVRGESLSVRQLALLADELHKTQMLNRN